ncbi:MAG: DMT family transporter [Planctomycetota bacterium]|nr:DMT family transporter [Planctomycetota bacterium]
MLDALPLLLPLAGAPFPWAGEVAAALSALFWGSAHIVFARIHPPISAVALNLGKNVFAAVFFIAALWIHTGSPIPQGLDTEALVIFAASGFLGLAVCDTLLMRSLLDLGPQRMTLLFLTVPVLVSLAATLPPLSESQPLGAWAGMLVCIGGIGMAIRRRTEDEADPARFRRGVRTGLLAALFQTVAILLARHGLANEDAPLLDSAVVRMAAGTIGVMVFGLFTRRLARWSAEVRRPDAFWMLAAASFVGTFLGIYANQVGLKWSAHAGVATTLNSLMPIYLLPLSVLFLRERFGAREIIATFVAVGGVALMFLAS